MKQELEPKFAWSRLGMKEATEYLKSINRYNEIKNWLIRPDSYSIWSFANRVYSENN